MLDRLLAAARDGEDWAGPALVTFLLPMLMGYVKEIGSDLSPTDQELAVERAILRSVDRIERFDPSRSQFTTWVRGALRFAVLDIREKGGPLLVDELPYWLETPSPEPSSDQASQEVLSWSLLQLSVADQIIISLRDFENLTYEQCAERIGGGVSAGACRVRHFRALKRLKETLLTMPEFAHLAEIPANE